jgi:hypothetical protein
MSYNLHIVAHRAYSFLAAHVPNPTPSQVNAVAVMLYAKHGERVTRAPAAEHRPQSKGGPLSGTASFVIIDDVEIPS